MQKPILYLFVGYPGAGKTSVAKIIAQHSNAVHLWADQERHKRFPNPTHSAQESEQLYAQLNQETEALLASGNSVIYDTNYNYFSDRELMRNIAAKHNAQTKLVWLTTSRKVAYTRAVHGPDTRNGYSYLLSADDFDRIAGRLQKPIDSEHPITINCDVMDEQLVLRKLGLQ